MRTHRHLVAVCVALLSSTPSQAQDWSGAYGAIGVSDASGTYQSQIGGVPLGGTLDWDGTQRHVMLGYNLQRGKLVYGAEVSYGSGSVPLQLVPDRNYLDGMLDVKGRVGLSAGKFLVYGALGWSQTEQFAGGLPPDQSVTASGRYFGVGADMLVNDRVFVGVEYQKRSLDLDQGDIPGFASTSVQNDLQSITLRLGVKF